MSTGFILPHPLHMARLTGHQIQTTNFTASRSFSHRVSHIQLANVHILKITWNGPISAQIINIDEHAKPVNHGQKSSKGEEHIPRAHSESSNGSIHKKMWAMLASYPMDILPQKQLQLSSGHFTSWAVSFTLFQSFLCMGHCTLESTFVEIQPLSTHVEQYKLWTLTYYGVT